MHGCEPPQRVLLLLHRGQVRTQVRHGLRLGHDDGGRGLGLLAVPDHEATHELLEGCDLIERLLLTKRRNSSQRGQQGRRELHH